MTRLFFPALVAAALVAAGPALADDHDPAWASGEALFKEGLALVEQAKVDGDARKYEEARRKFLAAYDIVHRPNVLFSVALAERKLDRPADALRHFRKFLREPTAEPKLVAQAKKLIAELSPKIGAVQVDAPAGADILIDGTLLGDKAPLVDPVDLAPGKHTLGARRGSDSVELPVEVTAGSTQSLALAFPQVAPPAPSPPPPVAGPVAAPPSPAPVQAPSSSSARWITAGGFALAGVAGVAIGGALLASAGSQSNKVASLSGQAGNCAASSSAACSSLSDALDAHARDQNAGTAVIVVGAALLAGGVVTWLVWPSPHGETTGYVAPLVTTGGGGAQWGGTF